jgi:RNA polymerase sigma-B factor
VDVNANELFVEFAASRDPVLRSRLVEQHLRLAQYLARRFSNRGESREDLEQVAALALVKAVDRFDPGRGVSFSTFATRTILGELRRHFRDRAWAMRPPRRLQELCLELNRHVESLTHSLGRSPTVSELAVATQTSDEEVLEAMEATQFYRMTSLDTPAGDGESLVTTIGSSDGGYEDADRRAELSPYVSTLPQREQTILYLRFVEDLTQSEIAERIGLSQMHVSRLLRSSLATLRKAYGRNEGYEGSASPFDDNGVDHASIDDPDFDDTRSEL